MKTRHAALFLMIATAPLAACRSSSSSSPDAKSTIDGANGAPDGTPSPDGPSAGCNGVYTTSTISAMRQGTVSGCFELDNVVSIALTPSTKSPKLFVQDAGGGDFSAMMTRCSSTSTSHPCTVAATVAGIADGHSVTIKGTYIKTKSTQFEEFFIDSITDNGAGTMPSAQAVSLADIERGGTAHKWAFERVTTTVAAADELQMFDWTPPEFVYQGATTCPYQFAFGMLPKSATGTATAACTSGTAQPAGQTTVNPAEVIIGTDFYKGFTISSDCRCAKMFSDMEPSTGSKVSGAIGGVLIFDVPFGTTNGYFYLAPKTVSDLPLSGTVAGM